LEKSKKSSENMKFNEEMVNSMCICESCPSYKAYGKKDDYIAYCYPTHGKSKNLAEHGCMCGTCPVYSKMNFMTAYYCTRGLEKEQKAAIADPSYGKHDHATHQL
jgi:hypothetical protein